MEQANRIKWYEVYHELAIELGKFYDKNKENSGYKLYDLVIEKNKKDNIHKWITRFDLEFKIKSIEPIHVLTSINDSKLNTNDRIQRINFYFNLLEINKVFIDIDFTGCPSPFSIKIMHARNEEIQLEIWSTFDKIIKNGIAALNEDVFIKIHGWYGINVSSFTIFLFWIDYKNFLPLDNNTVGFLLASNVLKEKPTSLKAYKELLNFVPPELYLEIVEQSYNFMHKGKTDFIMSQELFNRLKNNANVKKVLRINDFKIVAIKPLENTDSKILKVLNKNLLYPFYNNFNFNDESNIIYYENKDIDIYNIRQKGDTLLNINISALVGKNGSGKSSLTELFYLVINSVAKHIFKSKIKLALPKANLEIELYYYINTLFKLNIENKKVILYEYDYKKNGGVVSFYNPKKIKLDIYNLTNLFYSIAINYSHFALNSNDIGDWIQFLFHKNDAYQTPLAINPMRTNGNIDINKEKIFVKSRLLANILEPIDPEDKNNLRKLTDNGRSAKSLLLKVNNDKIKKLYNKKDFPIDAYINEILALLFAYYEVDIKRNTIITEVAKKYIYKKLVKISITYNHYKDFYNKKTGTFNLAIFNKYLYKLKYLDKSHVTYKLKQAIYFLKYAHFNPFDLALPIDINDLSALIETTKENSPNENLKTIELIPPSFFDVDIILDDDSNFELLSSGEKQKINTVASIVYHLNNINSVSESNQLNKYNYVNIIFDEVELYFHPEMQRTFIRYLLEYVKRVELNNIYSINFCFVTHSPFILSDIPNQNILFLNDNGSINTNASNNKTFGANIHDLLKLNFFLDNGYMGEFAKEKINDTIKFLNYSKLLKEIKNLNRENDKTIINLKQSEIDKLKKEIVEFDKNKHKDLIELIGEPILRIKLGEMYSFAFDEAIKKEVIENEIKKLQEILKNIE